MGVASAQTSLFGMQIDGFVELGGRVYIDEPPPQNRAKLEEYRDLDQQPFGAFGVRLFRPDESLAIEMGGSKIGQDDQEFFLDAGKPGLWRFDFDWNQIPHVYFGWTEGNPITYLLKFLAFGEGDTAPVTREVLRQTEHEPLRRPRVHVG